MDQLQISEMGPRHLSTTWTLLRPRFGQWVVSEVRYHDHNNGEVSAMPKRAIQFSRLNDALESIPASAVEQQGASTLRSWRYDLPMKLVS